MNERGQNFGKCGQAKRVGRNRGTTALNEKYINKSKKANDITKKTREITRKKNGGDRKGRNVKGTRGAHRAQI